MNDQNRLPDVPLRASICMATYNGAEFVEEQLASILAQLGTDDEIVIVDDASKDDTVAKIRELTDPRIRLIEAAANQGYVRSFEQAVRASRGAVNLPGGPGRRLDRGAAGRHAGRAGDPRRRRQ